MTKEEYAAKVKDITAQIQQLNLEKNRLMVQYLLKNKPCNKGDIVQVRLHHGELVKGVVDAFIVHDNGDFTPILYRVKKDGTPSSIRLRSYLYKEVIYPEKQPTKIDQ